LTIILNIKAGKRMLIWIKHGGKINGK